MAISERTAYATQPTPLRNQITDLIKQAPSAEIDGEIMALIVPDANLMSGGRVAAQVFKYIEGRQYDTVILISPSHDGPFHRINVCSLDTYRTPFGELVVNDRLRNELCDEDDDIYLDDTGHFHTEGVDVQLPFLQVVLSPGFDIVPVVMGEETPEFCRELGHAIGEVMYNRRTLLVASADILSADEESLARFREYFEGGEVSRLMSLLNSETLLMEGKGPLLVALIAALHRQASQVKIVHLEVPQGNRPGYIGALLCRA